MLFSLYTSPTTDIIQSQGLKYHLHVDDTQLYLTFNLICNEDHVTATSHVEACVWRIHTYLDKSLLEILIHAVITNKLEYCNCLLTGLPKYVIKRLQSVQNAAACLVRRTKKHDHIMPIVYELRWLPVEKHITHKVLLILLSNA